MDKTFVVIGDTHGNHKLIRHRIKSLQLMGMTLFHVGDFGVGFYPEGVERMALEELNKILVEHHCHLYVIRGNHDDPAYYQGNWEFSNLHLMPDYSVVEVNGDKVLMVGGSTSVDRGPRKKDMLQRASLGDAQACYWFDESFQLDVDKLKDLRDIKYVVAHNCPSFVNPINDTKNGFHSHGPLVEHFVIEGDTKLKDDLNEERKLITEMYNILNENNDIVKWFYGHYHVSHAEYYDETDFVTVNIDQFLNVIQREYE